MTFQQHISFYLDKTTHLNKTLYPMIEFAILIAWEKLQATKVFQHQFRFLRLKDDIRQKYFSGTFYRKLKSVLCEYNTC